MNKLLDTLHNVNGFTIRVLEVPGKNYVEVQFEIPGKFYRVKYMVNNHKFFDKLDYFTSHYKLDIDRKLNKQAV